MNEENTKLQFITPAIEKAGWKVVSRSEYNASNKAIAVLEGLLQGDLRADYLLYLNNMVVGVLEAKRLDVDINSEEVKAQAENYCHKLPDTYPCVSKPLPLVYLSNGEKILFRNLQKSSDYQELVTFPTPYEMCMELGIEDRYAGLSDLSIIEQDSLRECQKQGIIAFEDSLRQGYKRALLDLATGSGKTYTACSMAYRLLTYTPTRRILYLADRNNLTKQTEAEFGQFRLTLNKDYFTNIYTVDRVSDNNIDKYKNSNVLICTIQRLYSLLMGSRVDDPDLENDDLTLTMNLMHRQCLSMERNSFRQTILI